MREHVSILPPPYPPVPVKVWEDRVPKIKCPFCGTIFMVDLGAVECPNCGASYIVSEWDWNSFIIGLALGIIIGLAIAVGFYYLVLKPYTPLVRLAATARELTKGR